jgi:holo-[acyl-carrier protein] synthase
MNAVAHGIDIVDVARIARLVSEHGDRFFERCFTQTERDYANSGGRRRDEHLAARFAAKEAVLKALGTGLREGIAWTDIEVTRAATGEPGIELHGQAAAAATRRGIDRWLISLSHTNGIAMASVIGLA